MRFIKEIQKDIILAREKLWAYEQELKDTHKEIRVNCPHTKTNDRLKSDSYYDEGKMSAPHYFEFWERYCKRCGKILFTKHVKEEKNWGEWQKER